MADLLYAYAFAYRWGARAADDDPHYDPVIEAATAPLRRHLVAVRAAGADAASKSFLVGDVKFVREVFTFEVYLDIAPADPDWNAVVAPPWSTLPWHVLALMEEAVSRGWAAFSEAEAKRRGVPWLDLVRPQELKARLAALVTEFEREAFRPPALRAHVGDEEARRRWRALAAFHAASGHFLVTNGPYKLKAWSANGVTLEAFRDLSYPLGVGSYDAYAVPRRGFITKVERNGERLTVFGDIEVVEKFQRSHRLVRTPLKSVPGALLQRAAPECRYVITDAQGRVALAGTAPLGPDGELPDRFERPPAIGRLYLVGRHRRQRQHRECRNPSHTVARPSPALSRATSNPQWHREWPKRVWPSTSAARSPTSPWRWTAGRVSAKVLTTPRAPEEGVLDGIEQHPAAAGLNAGGSRPDHPRHDARHQRAHRAQGRQDGADHHRGLPRLRSRWPTSTASSSTTSSCEKPPPLVPRDLRFGVPERIDGRGNVLLPLDEAAVRALAPKLQGRGIEAVAIGYMHAYLDGSTSGARATSCAELLPGVSISPLERGLARDPRVRALLDDVRQRLRAAADGPLSRPARRGAARARLRLPAAADDLGRRPHHAGDRAQVPDPPGRIRARPAAPSWPRRSPAQCGLDKVLSFDMGGTTAKICLIDDGEPQHSRTFEVARALPLPQGQRPAAAHPGDRDGRDRRRRRLDRPGRRAVAHHRRPGQRRRRAGPGLLRPRRHRAHRDRCRRGARPHRSRLLRRRHASRCTPAAARRRARQRGRRAARSRSASTRPSASARSSRRTWPTPRACTPSSAARTCRTRTMIAFGGAAPLHAARLAEKLGIRRVVVPTGAGVGSAVGFLRAPVAYEVVRSRYVRLDDSFDAGLRQRACSPRCAPRPRRWSRPARREAGLIETRTADMRYRGQGHEIAVEPAGRRLRRRLARQAGGAFEATLRRDVRPHHPGPRGRDHELDAALGRRAGAAAAGPPQPPDKAAKPRGRRALSRSGGSGTCRRCRSIAAPTLRAGSVVPGPGGDRRGRDHHHRAARLRRPHQPDGRDRPRRGGPVTANMSGQRSALAHPPAGDVGPADRGRRGAGAGAGPHRLLDLHARGRRPVGRRVRSRAAPCWRRPSPARRATSTRWRARCVISWRSSRSTR